MAPQMRRPEFVPRFRELVNQYLDENEPLEVVAPRFAQLWMEWYRATHAQFLIPPGTNHLRFGNLGELRPNVTAAEAARVQELVTAAFALLPDSGVGAA